MEETKTKKEENKKYLVCITGKRALFTRPEQAVERQTYPVPTKSALKGILRAVFKHDGMNYKINKIYVCNPIETETVWRNEVTQTQEYGDGITPKGYINRDKCSGPRGSVFLKNVKYIVETEIILTPKFWPDSNEHPQKEYEKMFENHLRRGATQHTPWLGCREFEGQVEEFKGPIETVYKNKKLNFGIILEDIFYDKNYVPYPIMAETKMENGLITYGKQYFPSNFPKEEFEQNA